MIKSLLSWSFVVCWEIGLRKQGIKAQCYKCYSKDKGKIGVASTPYLGKWENSIFHMLDMKNWVIITVTVRLLWWLRQRRILQCRRPVFNPRVGKILWRREWLPTPVFLPGESHGQRTPWGLKESDRTEWLTLSLSLLLSLGKKKNPIDS